MEENKLVQLPWEDDVDIEEVDPVTEKPRFIIDDLGKANWALKKIAALRTDLNKVNDLANAEIEKIKGWQTKEKTRINSEIMSFETRLRPFAEAEVAGKKKKSVNCLMACLALEKNLLTLKLLMMKNCWKISSETVRNLY